jgi:hypothetical protein
LANSTLLVLFQQTMQGMGVAGFGLPASVIANTNQDVVQTLALVNAAGDELAREFEWQAKSIQYNFTATYFTYTGDVTEDSTSITGMSSIVGLGTTFMVTGTGIQQDTFVTNASGTTVTINRAADASSTGATLTFSKVLFDFPSDFDRPIDRTQWDRSMRWEMLGPSSAQQWEWLKSGWIATGPRVRFRPLGGYFAIWPPLATTEYLSYEYQSKYWVLATASTTPAPTKQYFTVDTDTCIFPDSLMRLLIKLKYFEVKNFDTTALYRDYTEQLDIAKAADAGSPTLSMNPSVSDVLLSINNLPDTGYGP